MNTLWYFFEKGGNEKFKFTCDTLKLDLTSL